MLLLAASMLGAYPILSYPRRGQTVRPRLALGLALRELQRMVLVSMQSRVLPTSMLGKGYGWKRFPYRCNGPEPGTSFLKRSSAGIFGNLRVCPEAALPPPPHHRAGENCSPSPNLAAAVVLAC